MFPRHPATNVAPSLCTVVTTGRSFGRSRWLKGVKLVMFRESNENGRPTGLATRVGPALVQESWRYGFHFVDFQAFADRRW